VNQKSAVEGAEMSVPLVAAGSIALAGLVAIAPAAVAEAATPAPCAMRTAVPDVDVRAAFAGRYDLYHLTVQLLKIESRWMSTSTRDGAEPRFGTKPYVGPVRAVGVAKPTFTVRLTR
jgi:hypothetical protein